MDDEDTVSTDDIDFYNPYERFPDDVDKDSLRPGNSDVDAGEGFPLDFLPPEEGEDWNAVIIDLDQPGEEDSSLEVSKVKVDGDMYKVRIEYVTDDDSDDWITLVDDYNPSESGTIIELDETIDMGKIRIIPLTANEEAEKVIFTADVFACAPTTTTTGAPPTTTTSPATTKEIVKPHTGTASTTSFPIFTTTTTAPPSTTGTGQPPRTTSTAAPPTTTTGVPPTTTTGYPISTSTTPQPPTPTTTTGVPPTTTTGVPPTTTATEVPPTTTTVIETTTTAPLCEYNGTVYDVDDTWNPEECMECRCEMENGIVCQAKECMSADECNGTLEYVEGECCPICKPKEKEECVKGSIEEVMEVDGCVSDGPVSRTTCSGSCKSHADAVFVAPFIETDCKCCKPVAMSRKSIQLTCEDGSEITHEYVEIEACACDACPYNPFAAGTTMATEITTTIA
jgi:hypothetical protein